MQGGQRHLTGRPAFIGMNGHRNSPAIVFHRARTVLVQGHDDLITLTSQGLINGVVDNLIHKMV